MGAFSILLFLTVCCATGVNLESVESGNVTSLEAEVKLFLAPFEDTESDDPTDQLRDGGVSNPALVEESERATEEVTHSDTVAKEDNLTLEEKMESMLDYNEELDLFTKEGELAAKLTEMSDAGISDPSLVDNSGITKEDISQLEDMIVDMEREVFINSVRGQNVTDSDNATNYPDNHRVTLLGIESDKTLVVLSTDLADSNDVILVQSSLLFIILMYSMV